jgi:hypothetical protein
MSKLEKIKQEDLTNISKSRKRALELSIVADRSVSESQRAALEHQILVQSVFLKHGLNIKCKVDETTGIVTWPEELAEKTEEVKEGAEDESE